MHGAKLLKKKPASPPYSREANWNWLVKHFITPIVFVNGTVEIDYICDFDQPINIRCDNLANPEPTSSGSELDNYPQSELFTDGENFFASHLSEKHEKLPHIYLSSFPHSGWEAKETQKVIKKSPPK